MAIFPINASIVFSVASGVLTTDPTTGNKQPATTTVELKAYLTPQTPPGQSSSVKGADAQAGLDEGEERLKGYIVEVAGAEGITPTEMPAGIGNLSKGWATVAGKTGWFTMYRGTPSPWGIEPILGMKISGVFKPIAPGGAGTQVIPQPTPGQYPADVNITAHRMAALVSGELVLANQSNVAHANAIAGMTLNAVSAGGKPQVQREGLIEDLTWNWTSGLPIFLGNNGLLTQDGSTLTTGFLLPVGWSPEPTRIWLEIEEPILL